jgi:hypothetical protein
MIKDLLQHKYSDNNSGYVPIRSPKSASFHKRSSSDQRSIISKLGDPKKNSDKLKFLLPSIRFPQQYDETE